MEVQTSDEALLPELSDREHVFLPNNCSEISNDCDSSGKRKIVNSNKSRTCLYFYNYGYCKFGSSCKYKHFKRETKITKPSMPFNMRKHKQGDNIFQDYNRQTFSKQNCRYFKTGACKNGDECKFFHSVDISDKMDALSVSLRSQNTAKKVFTSSRSSRKGSSVPLCLYFKKGLCRNGDECKFYHQSNVSLHNSEMSNLDTEKFVKESSMSDGNFMTEKENTAVEKTITVCNRTWHACDSSLLTADTISQLRSTEITQLKKRFPHSEVIIENQRFSILFQPSDPDWAFDVNKLKLEVDFPLNYPSEECKITVVQSDEYIPQLLMKYLNKAIFDWMHAKFEENSGSNKTDLIFRPFLKWFDKNLEDLFIIGLRKVKQDLKAKADGIEFVPVENLFSSPVESDIEICTKENTLAINATDWPEQSSISNNKTSSEINNKTIPAYYPSNNGMKIIFTDLEFIEGIGAFICRNISATLQCCRCKTSFNTKSVSKKSNSHICTKCSKNVGFTFEPATVHQFSSVLGNFHLMDCVAVDINLVECHFLIDCLNCSKQVPVDGIHYGQKHKMWCRFCNEKMFLSIGSVKFQALKLASDPAVKYPSAKKIEKKVKNPIIREGEPLPNFGACKHYKKSFRWLRFPCCGRLYPCDECHNEKETNHEMKYASRMMCGFCANEQPYSREKPCLVCSQSMTKKSGSHWEGGKGCRNKIQMSREDKQKYAGVAKTVSKKSQISKQKKKH